MAIKFNPFTGKFDFAGTGLGTLDSRYVNVTGDTMTGGLTIQPSTDTLTALVVNDKDSNNVLTVDTINNRVGIGTAAPGAKLEVLGTDYPTMRLTRTSTVTNALRYSLDVQHLTSADMIDGFASGMTFSIQDITGTANPIAGIAGTRNGADNTGNLSFYTYTAGSGTEKMTILGNGNVGIGTTNPTGKLEVAGSNPYIRLTETTDGNRSFLQQVDNANGAALRVYDGTAYSTYFKGGNVGIGTTNPGAKLEVGGTGNVRIGGLSINSAVYTDANKQLTSTAPATGTLGYWNRNGTTLKPTTVTDNVTTMGNVGIGITGPTAKLHIVGSADTQQLIVKANATQTTNLQEWQNSGGTVLSQISGAGNWGIGIAPLDYMRMRLIQDSTLTTGSVYGLGFAVQMAPASSATTTAYGVSGTVRLTTAQTSSGSGSYYAGLDGSVIVNNNIAGTIGLAYGGRFTIDAEDGTITTGNCLHVEMPIVDTGSMTTGRGLYIKEATNGSGTITNQYGIYIESLTKGGTLNYAIYTNTGTVLFGDKVAFTQTDGNEYIDSLADGYLDIRATTATRIGDGTNQTSIASNGSITLAGTATAPFITKLATVTGINAKTVAATTLYTVPTGKSLIVDHVVVRVTAFTEGSKSVQAIASVGGNATSYDDYGQATCAFSAINKMVSIGVTNYLPTSSTPTEIPVYAADTLIKLNITTGSDATVETWAVDVFGYLI